MLQKLLSKFKFHWGAIVSALVVGLVMLLPQILLVQNLGSEYKGIYIMKTDAEEHYLARMQEFVDNGSLNNPFLLEGRGGSPSASYTISESVLAFPAKIFPISVATLNLVYKFLLPFILTLLLYWLMFRITENRLWSLASAAAVILGHALFSVSGVLDLLKFNTSSWPAAMYGRPVNPEFSSILFLIYLHVVLSLIKQTTRKTIVWLAALFSLSFYIYFYSFTFFFVLNSGLVLYGINSKNKELYWGVIVATVIGIVAGVFALINMWSLSHHPDYKYLAPISNIVSGRDPVFSMLGLITLLLFAAHIFISRKKIDQTDYFLGLLIFTSFVVINQQVITGMVLQEGHYHWYFNTPIYILTLCFLAWKYLSIYSKYASEIVGTVLIALSILVSVLGQHNFYKDWLVQLQNDQRYAPALKYISGITNKNEVVLSNNESSLLLPILTKASPSWNYFTLAYLTPRERTIYALFLYMKLNDIKPELISESYFHPPVVNKPETKNNPGYEFVEINILLRDYMTGIYPDDMWDEYKEFYRKSWSDILKIYKMDYIVWDTKVDSSWKLPVDLLDEQFRSDGVVVFKLK